MFERVINSTDVRESDVVVNSNKINCSRNVFSSNSVNDSEEIICSSSVKNSKQIFQSSFVETSEKVFSSSNITDSTNIINSIAVAGSKNVWSSKQCFDSSEIIGGHNLENCFFCSECADSKNLLFCQDLKGVEYHIFNKPVTKRQFDLFVNQYKELMQEELLFVEEWPEDSAKIENPKINTNFREWYLYIMSEFWQWARTLPNYDPMLLYRITFDPNFLNEI